MHRVTKRFRGHSLIEHIPEIDRLREHHQCDSMLDYGCGKAAYWPTHWRVTGYDPAYEPFSTPPHGHYDMVICIDVMEHIPESATAGTLKEIFDHADKWVFLVICTSISDKKMPDGRSVHVNVKPESWWNEQLAKYENYTVRYTS